MNSDGVVEEHDESSEESADEAAVTQTLDEQLFEASRRGYPAQVRSLLNQRANPNYVHPFIRCRNAEAVPVPAVLASIVNGGLQRPQDRLHIVEHFMEAGVAANTNLGHVTREQLRLIGWTTVQSPLDLVRLAVSLGINVHLHERYGAPADTQLAKVLRLLFDQGLDLSASDHRELDLPCHPAATMLSCCTRHLHGLGAHQVFGWLACDTSGFPECVRLLCDHGAQPHTTARFDRRCPRGDDPDRQVDALDRDGRWYRARIVAIRPAVLGGTGAIAEPSQSLVHFLGWACQWDEWVNTNDLLPPGTRCVFPPGTVESRESLGYATWRYNVLTYSATPYVRLGLVEQAAAARGLADRAQRQQAVVSAVVITSGLVNPLAVLIAHYVFSSAPAPRTFWSLRMCRLFV